MLQSWMQMVRAWRLMQGMGHFDEPADVQFVRCGDL